MRKIFKNSQKYVLPLEKEPFKLECFEPYLNKIYFALGQILGVDCGLTKMPIDFMMLAINIQHPSINELYDFSTVIQDTIHEGLKRVEMKDEKLDFKHYSFLCHLIIFQNRFYWDVE